jgi:hypothetical protein
MDGGSFGTIDIAEGSFDECCCGEAIGRCRPDIVCVIESRERNRSTEHHPVSQLALHVHVLFSSAPPTGEDHTSGAELDGRPRCNPGRLP